MNPDWRHLRALWDQDEGALRDCYVPNTTVDDWQSAVDALRIRWPWSYTENHVAAAMPERVAELLERGAETAALWRVSPHPTLSANCHFFGVDEIEFDIDPREVVDQSTLDAVCALMQTIGPAVGRPVSLGVESDPGSRPPDDMRYEPAADRVVVSRS